MSVWREGQDVAGSGEAVVILPKDEIEEGAARSTARAVLEEIGRQQQRGEAPDLIAALEEVADRDTADDLMSRFEELRLRHEDLRRERKRAVDQHNRAVDVLDRLDREGIFTAEHRDRYEDAERVMEEQSEEIDRLNDEIQSVRDEMERIAQEIDRNYQTVHVLPSRPNLVLPDDPRKARGLFGLVQPRAGEAGGTLTCTAPKRKGRWRNASPTASTLYVNRGARI